MKYIGTFAIQISYKNNTRNSFSGADSQYIQQQNTSHPVLKIDNFQMKAGP